MLLKSGDKCWITTNAMPESLGTWEKNLSSASRPPAEAPIPTTNKGSRCRLSESEAEAETFDEATFTSLAHNTPY